MVPRTYGISPRRRNVMIGLWLIMTLPLAIPGMVLGEPGLLVSAVLITAIMVPIFTLAIRAARLHLTDAGIELHQLGMRVATTWDNVAGMRTVRGREGIVLHRPLEGKGAERMAATASVRFKGASFYDEEQQQLIAEHRFLPIEAFAYWLEHGDLRAVLAERVPALSVPEAFTPVAPPKLPRRTLAMIVAIIAAALAAGIAAALASPETQARIDQIVAVPLGLAMVVYAVVNVVAAARYFRRGSYGWFALWGLLAIVQLLAGMAIWSAAL